MSWYGILKVVHVLSAIVWMGGAVALTVVLVRLLAMRDRATLAQLVPQIARFMASVGGPASGDDAALASAGAKVRQSSIILISIMTVIVAAMVLKPSL